MDCVLVIVASPLVVMLIFQVVVPFSQATFLAAVVPRSSPDGLASVKLVPFLPRVNEIAVLARAVMDLLSEEKVDSTAFKYPELSWPATLN